MKNTKTPMLDFVKKHYHHFNARELSQAVEAWLNHNKKGGKMLLAMAGAMSSARIGISLAPMIKKGLIHAISCTGANLEESAFRLIAHPFYKKYSDYRYFTKEKDYEILQSGERRVTDMAIPEAQAFRVLEPIILKKWQEAEKKGERYFPHEYFYQVLLSPEIKKYFNGEPDECWLLEAAKKNLPIVVPGAEDSTMGNIFASYVAKGEISANIMKSGMEYMVYLYDEYRKLSSGKQGLGFFQIGGGISGDFPICVVPSLIHDLGEKDTRPWAYFCQISDSTTSYGSYSGATPNEKITWDKLRPETPMFVIESDASIVAPIIFECVLESLNLKN